MNRWLFAMGRWFGKQFLPSRWTAMDGVKTCRRFIDAIKDFPIPKNIHDARAWFGLINQVLYAFASSEILQPFRHLLQPSTPFVWTNHLELVFQQSKVTVVQVIHDSITIFNKDNTTCLATDWSKTGLGFWLLHKHCLCDSRQPSCCQTVWKTTLVGSRFTNKAESHYAL